MYRLYDETEVYIGIYITEETWAIDGPIMKREGIYSGFQGLYKFPYKLMASSYKVFIPYELATNRLTEMHMLHIAQLLGLGKK